jgi:general secretion pathway protein J
MKKSLRGFTLVELLAAIAILAIVAVLGWRGLDTIVRSRVALNEDLEQTRGLQLAFAQMQSDCGNIADTKAIGQRLHLSVQPGRLTMVRMVFADNQPSRVQVVAYRLNGGVLTRSESPATRELKEIDAAWNAAMNDAKGETAIGPAVALRAGIGEMKIRSWIAGSGWRDAGAQATKDVTTGMEVSLQLQNATTSMVKVFLLGAA